MTCFFILEEKLVCRSVLFSYKNPITCNIYIFNQPLLWAAMIDNTLPHYLTASNGFTSPPTTLLTYNTRGVNQQSQ